MARFGKNGRRCRFESLEDRQMMAGDVTAQLVHGNLVVKGDNFDNAITITAGVNPFEFVVTGVPDNNGLATTVNGTSTPVTIPGVTKGLKLNMHRGNDNVTLTGVTFQGSVTLKGGAGADDIELNNATINHNLKIKSGNGPDTVTLTDVTVASNTKIQTGGAHDELTITGSDFGKLKVSLGKTDDTLAISGTTVTTNTSLNGNGGINTFATNLSNFFGDLVDRNLTD
jgi:Planctomycete extracellular